MLNKFLAVIVNKILSLLGQALWHWLEQKAKNLKRKTEQIQAKEEYDKVMANPQASPEERANAYARYINSGRH